MRVLNAVTSLLRDVIAPVQVISGRAESAARVVKRNGGPTLSQPRVRGQALQKVRAAHFRLHPLCVHCKAEGRVAIATELDHIVALVNGGLDFDRDDGANRQGLCKAHHARKTAADLGYEYIERCEIGLDGWPKPELACLTGAGTAFAPGPTQPYPPLRQPTPPPAPDAQKVGVAQKVGDFEGRAGQNFTGSAD